MKRQLIVYSLLLWFSSGVWAQSYSSDMKKENIREICSAVTNWQIAHQEKVIYHPLDWTNGALYRGIIDWGKVSGDEKCYNFIRSIGEKYNWNMWDRIYYADDICVGQSFIEMYRLYGDKRMLQPVMERAYYIANHPSKSPLRKGDPVGAIERWSWSDALFMAPPIYAALYSITGDRVYLDYLDKEYKECVDSLYDKSYSLFYRDHKRISIRESNGAKQFWGRGNGWVFAGLPLIIDNLPIDCDSRNYYIQLFVEMAKAVRETQCEGGEWRTSLLNPDAYNMPETSGSAFMCYGLAWGIRNGYLSKRIYKQTLEKAWKSLVKTVHPNGKVGYIQPVGSAPQSAGYDATDVYGVGAFLMAGSELYKYVVYPTADSKS